MDSLKKKSEQRMSQNLPSEHAYQPAKIEGTLPEWMNGTLFRNGPGLTARFGQHYGHSFEGDGAITAVKIQQGQANYACRVLRTRAFEEEEQQRKQLYGFSAPWWRRMLNQAKGKTKTPANVNVMYWQDRLYAVPEGAPPIALDAETLDVLDEQVLGELGVGYYSPHPHYVAEHKAFFTYRLVWGKETVLSIIKMPDKGKATELISIPLDGHAYFHDFIVTSTHLLFFVPPVRINIFRAMLQIGPMPKLFNWKPELGTQVLAVPINSPGDYKRMDVEPFFLWHFANAQQHGTSFSTTYARWADFSVMQAIGDADVALKISPELSRATFDLEKGTFHEEKISDHPGEFPQSDPRRETPGLLWALTEDDQTSGIVAVNEATQTSRAFHFEAGQIASEPMFIAQPDGKLDCGVIASLVYDGASHRSFVSVLDAQRVEEGPLATIWFDHHIPMTFHGIWVPDEARD